SLPSMRRGDPQNTHSLYQPRILAHPHRFVSRLLVATSGSTLSQPRCSRVTRVPPSIASKRTSTSVPSSACPPSRYSRTRRTPGSHTVIRPTSRTSPQPRHTPPASDRPHPARSACPPP